MVNLKKILRSKEQGVVHIQKGDLSVLIDTSPDIKYQFQKIELNLTQLFILMNMLIKQQVFLK